MAKKYVSWKSEGAFHRGEVKSDVDGRITMLTIEGETVEFASADGVMKVLTRRPKPSRAVKAVTVESPAPIVVASPVTRKTRKVKDGSKKQRAIELFRAYFNANGSMPARKVGIELIMRELGMTQKGAATYWFNTKRVA